MKPIICAILATFGPLVGYLANILFNPGNMSFLGFAIAIAWTSSWALMAWHTVALEEGRRHNPNF